jgi:predicted Zn-dependent peptidase
LRAFIRGDRMVIIVTGDRVSGAIAKYLSNLEKVSKEN